MKGLKSRLKRNVFVALTGAAIATATAAAFQFTQDFEGLLDAGRRHLRQKEYSRALSDFSAAHARRPDDPDAASYLALTYSILDRPEESAWVMRAMRIPGLPGNRRRDSPSLPAPALPEQSAPNRNSRTVLPEGSHRPSHAVSAPARAGIGPDREIATYEMAGHPEKTLDLYDKLLGAHPGDVRLLAAAARNHAFAGMYDRAQWLYGKALEQRPGNEDLLMAYAEVLCWKHDYVEAAELYARIAAARQLPRTHAVNHAMALLGAGRTVESSELFDQLVLRHPEDQGVLLGAAEANFAARRYDRAETLYRLLAGNKADAPLRLNRLAEIAAIRNRYAEALAIGNELLARFPGNREALLTIARVSSWQRDYRTSLRTYDLLISEAPRSEALPYGREKARVLSWMQDYSASVRLYDALVAAYPDDRALRQEAAVERTYYRTAYRQAEKGLHAWLALEPENHEAWFELGQIYFQQHRWGEAGQAYDRLLALAPEHRNAQESKEKIRVLSTMNRLASSIGNFSSKSLDRRADVRFTAIASSATHPLNEDISVFLEQERRYYSFDSSPMKPTIQQVAAGMEYRGMPDLFARGGAGARWNPNRQGSSPYGFFRVETNPFDSFHFGGGYRRENVVDNPQTYASRLEKSSWDLFAYFDGYRRWNARLGYVMDDYSDGNRKILAGAELKAHIMYEPRRLSVLYRMENYGFRTSSDDYFSPSSFTTHTAGVEWQQYLNRKELFRGGNDTWYGTSYRIAAEPDGNLSHQVKATVYKDWSSRFSTMVEYQRTWNGRQDIYHDQWVNAEAVWHFK